MGKGKHVNDREFDLNVHLIHWDDAFANLFGPTRGYLHLLPMRQEQSENHVAWFPK